MSREPGPAAADRAAEATTAAVPEPEEPEVVAHMDDDRDDLPWCISCSG